jgi:hypothetical protein
MPINIKQLQQLQDIDKQLSKTPAIEMARQFSELQRTRDHSLNSLSVGVSWHTQYLKNIAEANTSSFSHIVAGNIGKNISQMMGDFAKNSFQDVFRTQMKSITETFNTSYNTSYSTSITTALEAMRNSLGVISTKELYNLRNFGAATNLSFISEIGMLAKSQTDLFKSDIFSQSVASLSVSHSNFLSNTFKDLAHTHSIQMANALKGSIILANEQMLRSAVSIEPFIHNLPETNINYLPSIKPNRFRVQRQELVKSLDVEEDETYDSLIIKTSTVVSFDLILNCLKIVGLCNETSLTTKGNEIFTLTNSVWSYSFKLLQIVPTNKETFAEIIDYLYFIFIEGAGKEYLRFVDYNDKKHFGYFVRTDPEVEVIWKIKHLRNKWLRHDIEHGAESDIKKSYQLRKEALEWFGMQKVPQSKEDFVFLYNNLILKVEEFLKSLLDRVSKFTN